MLDETNKHNVLIVDDDKNICQLISLYLNKDGLDTEMYYDGESAILRLMEKAFDLVLLDIMMPGIDGYETLKRIRTFSDVPIIMLSARGEPTDKIYGLDYGADDYITKPFEPQELIARIRAIMRRAKPTEKNKRIDLFNLTVNLSDFTVTLDNKKIEMPPKEIELLYTLVKTPMRVFTRDELLKEVWGPDYVSDSRTVDVHIKRVREKLGDNSHWKLTTVWGVGYKIEVF